MDTSLKSLECLFLCLPLIEDRMLKDFFYRVTGEPDLTYLMSKLKDFWEMIPDSPSKAYVEKYTFFLKNLLNRSRLFLLLFFFLNIFFSFHFSHTVMKAGSL